MTIIHISRYSMEQKDLDTLIQYREALMEYRRWAFTEWHNGEQVTHTDRRAVEYVALTKEIKRLYDVIRYHERPSQKKSPEDKSRRRRACQQNSVIVFRNGAYRSA